MSSSQHYTHFIDKLLYLNCIKYIGLKTCNKYTVQKSWVTLPSSQMFSRFFKTGLDKHQAWLETFAQYCTQLTVFICKAALLQLLSNNDPETWIGLHSSQICVKHILSYSTVTCTKFTLWFYLLSDLWFGSCRLYFYTRYYDVLPVTAIGDSHQCCSVFLLTVL